MTSREQSPFEDSAFANLFVKLRKPVADRVARTAVRIGEIRDGESLLDLGCGPGLISIAILKARALRYALLVDRSSEMVKRAKKNLAGIEGHFLVKKVDLENSELDRAIVSRRAFDHILAIDLWHLLDDRRRIANFILERCLSDSGNLTLGLHKEISERRMEEWHEVRHEIRNEIRERLETRYPNFSFGQRSRGAMAHEDEISRYIDELESLGFKVSKKFEDPELADINEMVRHLPESFMFEVKRSFPEIPSTFLSEVVKASTRMVLKKHKSFQNLKIATEAFYVLKKA